MGGGWGRGRVNKNKLMYQLRIENKKFISFDKYDYGGDLLVIDKVLSLKSFLYKMIKQTDGLYFLVFFGQRLKFLLFFLFFILRVFRRFIEKKKKNFFKRLCFYIGFFFLYIVSVFEYRDSEVVFFLRYLFGIKYYFFWGGGQGLG